MLKELMDWIHGIEARLVALEQHVLHGSAAPAPVEPTVTVTPATSEPPAQ